MGGVIGLLYLLEAVLPTITEIIGTGIKKQDTRKGQCNSHNAKLALRSRPTGFGNLAGLVTDIYFGLLNGKSVRE